MKRVLLTGNKGYIGSVLESVLASRGYSVTGLDVGYYEDCLLEEMPSHAGRQIRKDIRDVEEEDLEGIDQIVHLAALSNDPLGEFSPDLTREINYEATLRLGEMAKRKGIERFVYASSQSMYGISKDGEVLKEDESKKNPLTEYAKTKWEAELGLTQMNNNEFAAVFFRPSTVFGVSPRLRCDIVYNNLVGCGYTTGQIEIKSDGTPWRPVVHVRDVCSAFISGLEAPKELVAGRAFNVGIPDGNYTVRDLAEAAQKSVPGCDLKFTGEHGGDSRTYQVCFDRILSELSGYFQPTWDLEKGGKEMVEFFKIISFSEADFRGEKCVRLEKLKKLIHDGKINSKLRFS